MNASNFRIENVRNATLNGRAVKLFNAFRDNGTGFVFVGVMSAPARTAKRDLWKIAAAA